MSGSICASQRDSPRAYRAVAGAASADQPKPASPLLSPSRASVARKRLAPQTCTPRSRAIPSERTVLTQHQPKLPVRLRCPNAGQQLTQAGFSPAQTGLPDSDMTIRTGNATDYLVDRCKMFRQEGKNALSELHAVGHYLVRIGTLIGRHHSHQADVGTPVADQVRQQPQLGVKLLGPDIPGILVPIKHHDMFDWLVPS